MTATAMKNRIAASNIAVHHRRRRLRGDASGADPALRENRLAEGVRPDLILIDGGKGPDVASPGGAMFRAEATCRWSASPKAKETGAGSFDLPPTAAVCYNCDRTDRLHLIQESP